MLKTLGSHSVPQEYREIRERNDRFYNFLVRRPFCINLLTDHMAMTWGFPSFWASLLAFIVGEAPLWWTKKIEKITQKKLKIVVFWPRGDGLTSPIARTGIFAWNTSWMIRILEFSILSDRRENTYVYCEMWVRHHGVVYIFLVGNVVKLWVKI